MTSEASRLAVATTPPDSRKEVSSNTAAKTSGSSRSIDDDSNLSKTKSNQEEVKLASSSFIHSSKVRPEDVLCRTGNFESPGHVRFRALVKSRQDEYVKAKKGEAKTKIAREIIDEFYSLDKSPDATPRGRFLQPVEEGVWQELDNDAVLEKVKMALRQKRKNRKTTKATKKMESAAAANLLLLQNSK